MERGRAALRGSLVSDLEQRLAAMERRFAEQERRHAREVAGLQRRIDELTETIAPYARGLGAGRTVLQGHGSLLPVHHRPRHRADEQSGRTSLAIHRRATADHPRHSQRRRPTLVRTHLDRDRHLRDPRSFGVRVLDRGRHGADHSPASSFAPARSRIQRLERGIGSSRNLGASHILTSGCRCRMAIAEKATNGCVWSATSCRPISRHPAAKVCRFSANPGASRPGGAVRSRASSPLRSWPLTCQNIVSYCAKGLPRQPLRDWHERDKLSRQDAEIFDRKSD